MLLKAMMTTVKCKSRTTLLHGVSVENAEKCLRNENDFVAGIKDTAITIHCLSFTFCWTIELDN